MQAGLNLYTGASLTDTGKHDGQEIISLAQPVCIQQWKGRWNTRGVLGGDGGYAAGRDKTLESGETNA